MYGPGPEIGPAGGARAGAGARFSGPVRAGPATGALRRRGTRNTAILGERGHFEGIPLVLASTAVFSTDLRRLSPILRIETAHGHLFPMGLGRRGGKGGIRRRSAASIRALRLRIGRNHPRSNLVADIF